MLSCAKLISTGYTFKLHVEKTDMLLKHYVSSHSEEDGCIECQESGEKCIMSSFMICTDHQILLGSSD